MYEQYLFKYFFRILYFWHISASASSMNNKHKPSYLICEKSISKQFWKSYYYLIIHEHRLMHQFLLYFPHVIKKPWNSKKFHFLNSQIFFASSIKLLSCCCCSSSSSSWGNRVPFEHGWSYRKNSNAGKFVFPYWFIHKNFRLVRGPVFCPVSGFCTSDGPIEKITMQATLYSHTGSSIKISG